MRRILTILVLLCPLLVLGQAKTRELTGQILDRTDGTPLVVLGVEGDWVQVSVNDLVGYVYIDSVDGVQPSQPEVEDPAPEMKVTIFSSRRSEMALGETVYLTSRIEGFENYEIMYQWECDRGNGFEIISGANADSFAFEASVETLAYAWRLSVYYR